MKTRNLLGSLLFGLGLLTQALIAQGGPANGRGSARPDSAPLGHPDDCIYYVAGECPGCQLGGPEECPFALDGTCPNTPKLDGTGGPGKPGNPGGPQDGTAPGRRHGGGRG